MNTPISLKIAKLLKEKGFNVPTLYFYLDGKLKYNHSIQPILIFKKILHYHLLMYTELKSLEHLDIV